MFVSLARCIAAELHWSVVLCKKRVIRLDGTQTEIRLITCNALFTDPRFLFSQFLLQV